MSAPRQDVIVALSKVDKPNKETKPSISEYVCLGHFDRAVVKDLDFMNVATSFSTFNKSAYEGFGDYETIIRASDNPEGLQQNFLINSGKTFGTAIDNPLFTFMMTISVSRSMEYNTLDKCIGFFHDKKYLVDEELNKLFSWRFYYPVARGDIILMLDSNDFAKATEALYKFVFDNKIIIYSFTIPMVSTTWLKPETNHSDQVSTCCSLRLRATVRNYQKLYKLIDDIGMPDKPSYLASFGTDDVIVDFGLFSEDKMYKYLCYILSKEGQDRLKEAVFSSELDVPRTVNNAKNGVLNK